MIFFYVHVYFFDLLYPCFNTVSCYMYHVLQVVLVHKRRYVTAKVSFMPPINADCWKCTLIIDGNLYYTVVHHLFLCQGGTTEGLSLHYTVCIKDEVNLIT